MFSKVSSQFRTGWVCACLLSERRSYIENNILDPLKTTTIIYKDCVLPASYLCLTLLFHGGALLKHFLHLQLYCISTRDMFKICCAFSGIFKDCEVLGELTALTFTD